MSSVADTARTKYQEANAIDFQTYTASTGEEGTPKSRRQKLTKEEKRQNHIQSERVRRGRAKRQEEAREKYLTEKKFDLKSLWPSDIPKIDPTPSQGDKLTDEEKRQRHNLSEQNRRNRRNGYLNNLFSKAAELGYKSDSETVNTTRKTDSGMTATGRKKRKTDASSSVMHQAPIEPETQTSNSPPQPEQIENNPFNVGMNLTDDPFFQFGDFQFEDLDPGYNEAIPRPPDIHDIHGNPMYLHFLPDGTFKYEYTPQ